MFNRPYSISSAFLALCGIALAVLAGSPFSSQAMAHPQPRTARSSNVDRPSTNLPLPRIAPSTVSLSPAYRRLQREQSLRFEQNQGQTDARARFLARGRNYALFLTDTEALLTLSEDQGARAQTFAPREQAVTFVPPTASSNPRSATVRMRLIGANAQPEIRAASKLPGRSNYLVGNDPRQWRKNVPSYGRVEYQAVYPGINMAWYGKDGELEHDFLLAPGANPHAIRVEYTGLAASSTHAALRVDAAGDLLLRTPVGELRQRRPVAYQEIGGRHRPVAVRYRLLPPKQRSDSPPQIGFQVAAYDRKHPLVIDPVLEYSTYLGGKETDDLLDCKWGPDGSVYLLGLTNSIDFPTTPGAFQRQIPDHNGSDLARSALFITRVAADGASLRYSTYLGGTAGSDLPRAIAVAQDGSAWVTGSTGSPNFPTRKPLQAHLAGAVDAFISHLDPTGSTLLFSTYFGGSDNPLHEAGAEDLGKHIAIDRFGDIYVAGETYALDFPTSAHAFQTANRSQQVWGSYKEAFAMKLHPAGTLVYATYLGGKAEDGVSEIVPDGSGNLCVLGYTRSDDFPVKSAAQSANGRLGTIDLFLARLNLDGSELIFSTYLGGSDFETGGDFFYNFNGSSMTLDSQGNILVGGSTFSTDFPTTSGAFQTRFGGVKDAFLTKYTPQGTRIFSTLVGGESGEVIAPVAIDTQGNAYVCGQTASTKFPVRSAYQSTLRGLNDAFVCKFDPLGKIQYATYLGGGRQDSAVALSVDAVGRVFLVGTTQSTDFPVVEPLQPHIGEPTVGNFDSFITELRADGATLLFSTYLGGFGDERFRWIKASDDGGISVVGTTNAANLLTRNALQSRIAGKVDLFLLKIRTPPDPPTSLIATAVSIAQIDLIWQDGSTNETGFEIERQTGAAAFARIATVGANVTAFSSRGLQSKTTYQYRVRAIGAGGGSFYTNIAAATTFPNLPAAPTGLTVTALSGTSLRLNWQDGSNNETGFEIERKPGSVTEGGEYRRIFTTAANLRTYIDTGLTADTRYAYRVRAVNGDGPSAYTSEIDAATLPPMPAAPTSLTARADGSTLVTLAWVDRSENESGFEIERQTGSGAFNWIAAAEANLTEFQDNHAPTESRLTYRVRAINLGGASAYSNNALVQTLAAPTGLQVRLLTSTQVQLGWADRSANESSYAIERRTEETEFAPLTTTAANSITYTDGRVTPETTYFYRVRARQGTGSSSPTAEVAVTPLAAPEALAASPVDRTVLLSWSEPGEAQSGVRIERRTGSGAFTELGSVGKKVGSYQDRSVAPRTLYTYRVRAASAAGYSSYSNLANAQTPDILPPAPSGLTAATGYGLPVDLRWTDTSPNESGFQVERRGGTSGVSYRLLGTTRTNEATYRDATAQPSVTYTYRVRAVNSIGTSGYSNEATATPLPTLLTFTVKPTQMRKGKNGKGTVTLTGAAPAGGATVALTDSLVALTVPGSVKVAAGKNSATFVVKAKAVKKKQSGTVSATYGGVTKTVAVTVLK